MRMCRLVVPAVFWLCSLMLAQQALDNAAVVKMAKAGMGDDLIVSMIQGQPGHYELTPDTLVSLKGQGVSEKVLSAMAAKNAAPATPPPAAGAAKADPYDDLDIGVYYKLKDVWTPITSEAVNWKTGGVLKSFATNGIVKGDVNGHLNGKQSVTELRTPLQILIKTAEGVEATDYQLVHMHVNSDNREFRTKTGGVFHSSGGATKDAVQFTQEKIAKHIYTVTLPDKLAEGGEYGFLAPGLTNSSASGSTGKAYTFHFLE